MEARTSTTQYCYDKDAQDSDDSPKTLLPTKGNVDSSVLYSITSRAKSLDIQGEGEP